MPVSRSALLLLILLAGCQAGPAPSGRAAGSKPPKLVVAMGDSTVTFFNDLRFPLSDTIEVDTLGSLQRFTATIEALVTPDVDESLDDQPAKTAFWKAFKALGPWWSEQPPY